VRVAQLSQVAGELGQQERVVAVHAEVAAHEWGQPDDISVEDRPAGGAKPRSWSSAAFM